MAFRKPRPVSDIAPGSTLYDTLRAGILAKPEQNDGVVYQSGRFVMANDWITLYDSVESAKEIFDDAVEYFSQPSWSVK